MITPLGIEGVDVELEWARDRDYVGLKVSLEGLSSDTKPMGVKNGSAFYEMDTGAFFKFDEQNQIWREQ